MNIAIVIENFDPQAGGNERSTSQLAGELVRRGHRVTILAGRATGPVPPTIQLEILGRNGTRSALGLWQFRKQALQRLQASDFDVSLSMTTAVPADVIQPRSGTIRETLARNAALVPHCLGRHLKTLANRVNPKRQYLLRAEAWSFSHPRVRKVVAISPYVADQLTHHYRLAPHRIALIPNAVHLDIPQTAHRQALRRQTRRALQLAEADIAYLFVALNPRLKGLEPLLCAFSQVRLACPAARLLVAGTMDLAFRRRAQRMGLAGDLRWVGPTARVIPLYLAADVTVLPTWYDPCSRVVLESLRLGTPAISTWYNGASQWIADPTGRTEWPSPLSVGPTRPPAPATAAAGHVIDAPDRIDQLAQAMLDLADADRRENCRHAAATLDKRLTISRHVDALERLLGEVSAYR